MSKKELCLLVQNDNINNIFIDFRKLPTKYSKTCCPLSTFISSNISHHMVCSSFFFFFLKQNKIQSKNKAINLKRRR